MNILVYGDSNSWGYLDDGAGLRTPHRWPQVMAKSWSGDVHLVEACLPGRTTGIDDPEMGAFVNGHTHLLPTLLSHQPIDLVIIMLGTNDFKARFNRSVEEIAQSILDLAKISRNAGAGSGRWREGTEPKICVVAPPALGRRADDPNWDRSEEWLNGRDKSLALPAVLRAQAARPSGFCLSTQMTAFNRQKPTRYIGAKQATNGLAYLWRAFCPPRKYPIAPPFIGCRCRRVRQHVRRQRRIMLSFGAKPTIQLLTNASALKQHSCPFT